MKKYIYVLSLVLFCLAFNSCESEDDKAATNEHFLILTSGEWLNYYKDYSGYISYIFNADGTLILTYYNYKDEEYKVQYGKFNVDKFSVVVTINNITDKYTIKQCESRKVVLWDINSNKEVVLDYLLSDDENKLLLQGKWEKLVDKIYTCLTFDKDGTYTYEQIINHSFDDEDSQTSTYKVERTQIIYNSKYGEYRHFFRILPDGKLFLKWDRTSDGIYTYLNGESEIRPKLTVDSEYFEELTKGKWIMQNHYYDNSYSSGFSVLEFTKDEKLIKTYYNKEFTIDGEYEQSFSINGDTLSGFLIRDGVVINSLSDKKLSLEGYRYGENSVFYYYDEKDFTQYLLGRWSGGWDSYPNEEVWEFNSDGTYKYNGEILEEGTYKRDFLFVEFTPTKLIEDGEEGIRDPYTYQIAINWDENWIMMFNNKGHHTNIIKKIE